ncbi:hypothetical protein HAX54_036600 [Datura stramonium]|uniref:Uncharacterized protein n=1 Tax=Datura stramonium TaxID=4076 RepID=A0ABS8VH73_DATST|nr:hypothetical protein [Datura stramonium]
MLQIQKDALDNKTLEDSVKVDDDEEPAPEVVDPSGERSSLDNESQGTSLENQQQIHALEISQMMEHVPHKSSPLNRMTNPDLTNGGSDVPSLPRRSVTSAVTLGPRDLHWKVQMMVCRWADGPSHSPLSHNDQVKDRHSIDDHHSHRQNHDALSMGRH